MKIQGFSEGGFQNGVSVSRPPRYDRFGNPPCMLTPLWEVTTISNRLTNGAPPRYVLLRCPKSFARFPLAGFRPLPLLFARFFRHRRRSQTSPLRVPSVLHLCTRDYTRCARQMQERSSAFPSPPPALFCCASSRCRVDSRAGMDYSTEKKRVLPLPERRQRGEGRAWTNTS